jgi:tyrosyl-tRNA synthetase
VGGATGMIGDPSGKSNERNLLDEPTFTSQSRRIKGQLSRFFRFYFRCFKCCRVSEQLRLDEELFFWILFDIGKHITVNYMMSKDSVKKRLSSEAAEGMSFTEFTYQLVQGYDFYLKK